MNPRWRIPFPPCKSVCLAFQAGSSACLFKTWLQTTSFPNSWPAKTPCPGQCTSMHTWHRNPFSIFRQSLSVTAAKHPKASKASLGTRISIGTRMIITHPLCRGCWRARRILRFQFKGRQSCPEETSLGEIFAEHNVQNKAPSPSKSQNSTKQSDDVWLLFVSACKPLVKTCPNMSKLCTLTPECTDRAGFHGLSGGTTQGDLLTNQTMSPDFKC